MEEIKNGNKRYHFRIAQKKNKLSQDELARKILVTRQAVSRWENGETIPNTETLKLLSKEFNVSINTLLGSPRKLICQCCGMPLTDDSIMSHESDGSFNEEQARSYMEEILPQLDYWKRYEELSDDGQFLAIFTGP